MLLFIAFALFAALFAGWLIAPTEAPARAKDSAAAATMTEPGTASA